MRRSNGQDTSAQRRLSLSQGPAATLLPTDPNSPDVSFAAAAAKRNEKRRLCGLVRLVDIMVAESLHVVVMGAMHRLLTALQAPGYQRAACSDAGSAQQAALQVLLSNLGPSKPEVPSSEDAQCVLSMELLLGPGQSALTLRPPVSHFVKAMSGLKEGLVAAVLGVKRLLLEPQLQVERGGCWRDGVSWCGTCVHVAKEQLVFGEEWLAGGNSVESQGMSLSDNSDSNGPTGQALTPSNKA